MSCQTPELAPSTSYKRGCRCERCVAASSARWLKQKERRHGTLTGSVWWDARDRCWRVVHDGAALLYMRFATAEAAEQHIALRAAA